MAWVSPFYFSLLTFSERFVEGGGRSWLQNKFGGYFWISCPLYSWKIQSIQYEYIIVCQFSCVVCGNWSHYFIATPHIFKDYSYAMRF